MPRRDVAPRPAAIAVVAGGAAVVAAGLQTRLGIAIVDALLAAAVGVYGVVIVAQAFKAAGLF